VLVLKPCDDDPREGVTVVRDPNDTYDDVTVSAAIAGRVSKATDGFTMDAVASLDEGTACPMTVCADDKDDDTAGADIAVMAADDTAADEI